MNETKIAGLSAPRHNCEFESTLEDIFFARISLVGDLSFKFIFSLCYRHSYK